MTFVRQRTFGCPHCKEPYLEFAVHVCDDHDRWTPAERDTWREQARRLYPALKFVPNSMQLADQLGSHSRREEAP